MTFVIEDAVKSQAKAKVALVGPAGSGKTYTALVTAQELGENILVLDTENKSSVKYADQFKFKVLAMPNYAIKTYIEALDYAAKQSFDVVIVDSLSHAWAGKGGALEQAELAGRSKYGGNKFAGWADVTPLQNDLIDSILNYPAHLIATMRMKIEYALITDTNGRQKPQKLGLGIVQRDSFEYEFDIVAQMDVDHNLSVTKTRCFSLDGYMAQKPNGEMGQMIQKWLSGGAEMPLSFATIDDLLYQLHIDCGLDEAEAKAALKGLGYTGFPTTNVQRKSTEMYLAVKNSLADVESGAKKTTGPISEMTPLKMLESANTETNNHYTNVNHLRNAIRKTLGDDKWDWPAPTDDQKWNEARVMAVEYANAPKSEPAQTAIAEAELPF